MRRWYSTVQYNTVQYSTVQYSGPACGWTLIMIVTAGGRSGDILHRRPCPVAATQTEIRNSDIDSNDIMIFVVQVSSN